MIKITKKYMGTLLIAIFLFSSCLITSSVPLIASDSLTYEDKQQIINTPVFYVLGQQTSKEDESRSKYGNCTLSEKEMVSLDDMEFKKVMSQNLQWAVEQRDLGSNIYWHPEAMNIIELVAPELTIRIKTQLDEQQEIVHSAKVIDTETLRYSPGNTSQAYYLDNVSLGLTFWRFNKRANWAWDTSGITSVSSSCWASQVWPGWTYNGVVDNDSGWVNQPHSYFTYSLGYFSTIVQSSYPYINITVYAGGSSSASGGFE